MYSSVNILKNLISVNNYTLAIRSLAWYDAKTTKCVTKTHMDDETKMPVEGEETMDTPVEAPEVEETEGEDEAPMAAPEEEEAA